MLGRIENTVASLSADTPVYSTGTTTGTGLLQYSTTVLYY
eukprot:COSAG01_NODE_46898_length_395_cov_3.391892_1_plen_39_part_10